MSSFDRLPTKVLHRVFNHLEYHDILRSLRDVSLRLNTVLNTYDRFQLNFQSISMPDFHFTLHRIDPSRVISLTLSNMDDTPGQYRSFLALFSLKQFLRLQSLQLLQPPNPIDLNAILAELQTLNSLKSLAILHCPPSAVNQDTFALLSSFIHHSTSLRRLCLSGTLNLLFEHDFHSPVHHLYFNDSLFNTVPLQTIVSRMPSLKSLDTAITTKGACNHLPPLMHLTRLTLTVFVEMPKSDMELLLSQLPVLSFLKITANGKQWFNGQFWEQSLPATVQTFQFNFCTQSIHLNEEMVLETFQTSYWMDFKRWYAGLDYQMNPTMTHLYSLPYCETHFYYRPSKDPARRFRSSVPISQPCMEKVNILTVDLSTLTSVSPSSHHFFANVYSLILADHGSHLSAQSLLCFLESILDLGCITELKLGQFHHPDCLPILYDRMPRLKYLRVTESMLIDQATVDFPNIRHLTLCDCPTNIERICSLFPRIQYLCIRLLTVENIRKVFELWGASLTNVTFRHISEQLQEQTIQYLLEYCGEQRRYSYDTDQHMDLHIWLED